MGIYLIVLNLIFPLTKQNSADILLVLSRGNKQWEINEVKKSEHPHIFKWTLPGFQKFHSEGKASQVTMTAQKRCF